MVQAETLGDLYLAIQQAAIALWNFRAAIADATVIEAGSMTIGNADGLRMVIDSQGQRIYDKERLVWPEVDNDNQE
jgi:hypothetical protein